MKKILFLIPIVMLSLLMSSCKGDEGPMGPPGVGYYISGYKEVNPNQWTAYGAEGADGSYFEYAFDVKELDNEVFENGVVNTFVEVDGEKYQLNKTLPQYDASGKLLYFIYYDYSYVQGRIYFRVSYSDNAPVAPDKQLFYFVLQSLD